MSENGNVRGFDPKYMQELKQKNDIVEVIGSYVSLNRKGNTHWACCPFHHEKTPSFSVDRKNNIFTCFGCGETGDVITFVAKLKGIEPLEAVKLLAEEYRVDIEEKTQAKKLMTC